MEHLRTLCTDVAPSTIFVPGLHFIYLSKLSCPASVDLILSVGVRARSCHYDDESQPVLMPSFLACLRV
jgi:hypothetical protein